MSSHEVAAIELHQARVTYGHPKNRALDDVTLSIPKGSHVAIVGPNGAGKTTMFNAILGLVPLAHGHVRIFGKAPHTQRGRVSYIPQRESVDWHFPLTAMDIAMMGRIHQIGWRLRPRRADREAAAQALRRVGMWEH